MVLNQVMHNRAVQSKIILFFGFVIIIFISMLAYNQTPAFAVTAKQISEARKALDAKEEAAEQCNEKLNQTNVDIENLNSQIKNLETSIKCDHDSLRQQMRSIYKTSDDVSTLSAIFFSDSFIDAVDNIANSTKIQNKNIKTINDVISAKEKLNNHKKDLQSLAAKQKTEKTELNKKAKEAEDYLNSLNIKIRDQLGITDTSNIPDDINSGTNEAWRDAVLMVAYANLGGSYIWGGSSFKASDCSGLVMQCYKSVELSVPHSADTQGYYYCKKPISQAIPGDIVWRSGHVGIYIGNGKTIEAHSPSRGISYGNLSNFVSCGSPCD